MKNSIWRELNLIFELGFLIVVPIILFGLLGAYLDEKFSTSPLFLLSGILIAIVISGAAVYRKIKSI